MFDNSHRELSLAEREAIRDTEYPLQGINNNMSAQEKSGRFEEDKLPDNRHGNHAKESSSNRSKDPFKRRKSITEDRQPFTEFPEVTSKTVEDLQARGIMDLFPIQASTFGTIY